MHALLDTGLCFWVDLLLFRHYTKTIAILYYDYDVFKLIAVFRFQAQV